MILHQIRTFSNRLRNEHNIISVVSWGACQPLLIRSTDDPKPDLRGREREHMDLRDHGEKLISGIRIPEEIARLTAAPENSYTALPEDGKTLKGDTEHLYFSE